MKKFKITITSVGGGEYTVTERFKDFNQATDFAHEEAISDLESFGGLHGLPDPDSEDFLEEAESWINYEVEEVKGGEEK